MEDRQLRILIVEDDKEQLKNYYNALSIKYSQVFTASSSKEAIVLVQTVNIDVLITDLLMDKHRQDGLDLIEMLKQQFPALKIIIVSGYFNTEIIDRAINLDTNYFIFKPLYFQILFKYLHDISKLLTNS